MMNRVLSTHVCVNHRLTVAWLNRALQAGIPAVEIFCARQHLDYRDRGQIAELGHWFRDADLKLHSIHSPMYNDIFWGRSGPHSVINITETLKSKRMAMVDEVKRALDIAEFVRPGARREQRHPARQASALFHDSDSRAAGRQVLLRCRLPRRSHHH